MSPYNNSRQDFSRDDRDSYNISPEEKRQLRNKKIVGWIWKLFAIGVVSVLLLFLLIYNGWIGYMPAIEELQNPNDKFATVIYSADGEEMGRYYRNSGNRVYADYSEISPYIVDALISTEDSRFLDHSGIDLRAFGRVLVKTLIMRHKNAGGGSTITQQLAKQLYSPETENVFDRALQKPIEWMIAVKLERYYSKDEIIKMYLNQFDFLYNAVGIKSAAFVYFGKQPKDLTIEEAATLVGMVKNPAYYNPVRHPERTRERRNVVFEQMYKNDKITKEEMDSLKQLPLELHFTRVDHKDGLAPYFREELRRVLTAKKPNRADYRGWEKQKFIDDSIAWETNPLYGWIEKNPKPDGSKYDLYTDGLRIHTTIDSRMQRYAEEAVQQQMSSLQAAFFREKKGSRNAPYTSNSDELGSVSVTSLIQKAMKQTDRYRVMKKAGASEAEIQKAFNTPHEMSVFSYKGTIDTVMTPRDSLLYQKHFLRTGFMSVDPRNGYVKAYVGGPNFTFFQYDMVSTGRRQIGSTIKPFLYTYAMEEGFTPCDRLLNAQPVIIDESGKPWMPRNSSSSRVGEMVDLRWALTTSNNWISARLMEQLSPQTLVRNMHNFGITNTLNPVMSICLGSCEVSVKEMVGAYTAYANNGMRSDPIYVSSIADANGNIISEFSPRHTEVISEAAYAKILSMLLNVVDSGTANRLRRPPFNLTAEMGGKTGTTNYNSDAWFMAFSPELVCGAWVGGDERYIHFNSMANGQGAAAALPIVGIYLTKVFNDPKLSYSQNARFNVDFSTVCNKEFYDYVEETPDAEETITDVFD
jgi:penicillin-binding protein 1A